MTTYLNKHYDGETSISGKQKRARTFVTTVSKVNLPGDSLCA